MNKSLSAAIAGMLMITASAWAASPESQAIRPMGDNMPDPSPTEQAEQMRDRDREQAHRNDSMGRGDDQGYRDENRGQHGESMRDQHSQSKDPHGEERWKDEDYMKNRAGDKGNRGKDN